MSNKSNDINWDLNYFKKCINEVNRVTYDNMMSTIMACGLRKLVTSLGETMLSDIKNGNISPDQDAKEMFDRLLKCYSDPVKNEQEIFMIRKELDGRP